jgi:quercetin dioxygenase-like cupin family protein
MAGEIAITSEKGEIVLKPHDSVVIGANESRGIKNDTNFPVSMVVVINYPG